MDLESLYKLYKAAEDVSRVVILPHNDPDPDAIASSVAIGRLLEKKLNIECQIVYKGIVGRAENKALVKYLGTPIQCLDDPGLLLSTPVVMVDTQPGTGNNPLPPEVVPIIVIDHHTGFNPMPQVPFVELIQAMGSCSTIMTRYLQLADVEIDEQLATALFYGIKSDTRELSRQASPADVEAYFFLQPLINVEAMADIEHARVPPNYFKSLVSTLHTVRIYDDTTLIAYMEDISDYPDIVAEMADTLLRLQNAQWVVCMNLYMDTIFVSVRTNKRQGGADGLVLAIINADGTAGGHGMMAGGQIPLRGRDYREMVQELTKRALDYLGIQEDEVGKPLV